MKDKKEIESLKARQAELARELKNIGESIGKMEAESPERYRIGMEFVPGWEIVEIELNSNGSCFKKILTIVQETKGQIYTPHTRYNWPEIIKKYPEAQWASTDADGRIDAWDRKPKGGYGYEDGRWVGCGCKSNGDGGHKHVGHTKDWADSLEKRPDNL